MWIVDLVTKSVSKPNVHVTNLPGTRLQADEANGTFNDNIININLKFASLKELEEIDNIIYQLPLVV